MRTVRIYDTVSINPLTIERLGSSIEDGMFAAPQTLYVEIAATHAGRITRNHGFYLPQKMREAAGGMVEGYGKPVLKHHSSHEDPIGRVVGAKYVDTSVSFTHQDATTSTIIDALCDRKTPFLKVVDLVEQFAESDILRDPQYPGLGYIQVRVAVSDQDAIKKILDKRFLTVSIGATTDKAICSVCKTDWIEDKEQCEHRPGKIYDGKLCFIIAGNLIYDEVSFVNTPADPFAQVISINQGNGVFDEIKVEALEDARAIDATLSFQDVVGGFTMDADAKKKKEEERRKAEEDAKKAAAEKKKKEEKETAKALEDAKNAAPVLSEEDQHYEDMVGFSDSLGIFFDATDKKLTPEARKKLRKTVFCKPADRKYPVPDCSHARSAMAYAKKHNEASGVVDCIKRKAKALGCPFSDEWEKELNELLADEATQAPTDEPAQTPDDNADTYSRDEMEEQLKALRKELQDSYNEATEMEDVYVELLDKMRRQLADCMSKLEVVSGKETEDITKRAEEISSLKVEDLLKNSEELSKSVDLKKITDKLNDGMTGDPTETVDDPTANISDDPSQTDANEDSRLTRIRDAYKKKLEKGELGEADAYIQTLKNAGFIPADFNPITPTKSES